MPAIKLTLKLKFSPGDFFIRNYYIFVMAFYFLSMIFPVLRPGVLISAVLCLIIIANPNIFTFKLNFFHLVLFLYIVYNLFSVIYYFGTSLPVSVFIREVSNSILPVIFFFIGKRTIDEKNLDSFIKIFSWAGVFCLLVGVYFIFFPNDMYFEYLEKTIANFYIGNYMKDQRLNSFLGSTEIGSLSSILAVVALSYIIKDRLNLKYLLLYSLAVLCVGLSMQRSAIVISGFMVVIWHIYGIGIGRINYNFLFAELLFVSIAFIQVFRLHAELLVQVMSRLSAFSTAISERSDTWFNAISNSPNIILGSGLGSVGHKALGFTKYYVHDGSFFKILAETGIIGFSLFMIMIILTYAKFFSTKKNYRLEISIISILLFQAIGSNVLAFQTLLPVFWFSIGRIWSYKKVDL